MKCGLTKLVMLVLVLLPGSLSKFYTDAESLKEGLLLASLLAVILIIFKGRFTSQKIAHYFGMRFVFLIALISLHVCVITNNEGFNTERFFLSLIFLLIILILWIPIADTIFSSSPTDFDIALRWCYWLLFLDGLISGLFHTFFGDISVFFAAEPSHFALSFLPFLFYMVFNDRSSLHLWCGMVIAVMISNLTMLAGVVLIAICYFWRRKFFLIAFLLLGTMFIFMLPSYNEYVLDRLTFSLDSKNLSTLILLSGYERAYETISSGYWLGVGFQQMGFIGPPGDAMSSIKIITGGSELNLYDGGTLASKLVTEFGFLGLICLVVYLVNLFRIFFTLNQSDREPHILFFQGLYITFTCYLFVRGMGYMSPMTILALIAYLYLGRRRPFYNY